MKDQTLADINDDLVEAGMFLSEFTGDKLECINRFCECKEIVDWIRNTTDGCLLFYFIEINIISYL